MRRSSFRQDRPSLRRRGSVLGECELHAHDAKRSQIKHGERSRRGPHVRRSRRRAGPRRADRREHAGPCCGAQRRGNPRHEWLLSPAGGRTKPARAGGVTRASGGSAGSDSYANEPAPRGRAAQFLRVSRRPAASRRKERVRTKAPCRYAPHAKGSPIKHDERRRRGPHVRRSRRRAGPRRTPSGITKRVAQRSEHAGPCCDAQRRGIN